MDLEYLSRPPSPPVLPPEHPYWEEVRKALLYHRECVAAGIYERAVSPTLGIDPKLVDPGCGISKPVEEESYSLDDLSDPEPSESESSSSSRASSPTFSDIDSDIDSEDDPIPPPPAPRSVRPPNAHQSARPSARPSVPPSVPPSARPYSKWKKPPRHLSRKKKVKTKKTYVKDSYLKLLACQWCGTTVQFRQMERHKMYKHPELGVSVHPSKRTCGWCNKLFSRVDSMKRHMARGTCIEW